MGNVTTSELPIERDEPLSTVERVKAARTEADRTQSAWREEARQCYAFVAGDQWSETDKAALEEQMRAAVVFNRVGPMVDSVAGSEVNNRQAVRYVPRQSGDSAVNEILSGAADYVREQCDAEDEESDAFLDAVTCGVGWTEIRMDYSDNPDGDVQIRRIDPLSMRWDPAAKQRNLSDRRWQQHDEMMSLDEIEALWPDKADEIAASASLGTTSEDEGETHNADPIAAYRQNPFGYERKTGRVRVTRHQWWELQTYHAVLDPATGQMLELDQDQFSKLAERVKAITGAEIEQSMPTVRKSRKVYRQAFVSGDLLLEEGDCPCNRFSYHALTAKRDRNKGTWYGIVRPMMDPQRWANKFLAQILHIINTNAKGGLVVEADAVANIRKFKEDWAKADSVVEVEPGTISGSKIMPKPIPQYPVAIDNLLQFSISSLRDVTGINLELLGMADRQQAGILEAQRKQAAMTVLATLFDSLRRYRKESGRTLAKYIVEYISDGRLVRIISGNGLEQFVPLVRDPQAMEYDVIVDEAPNTVDKKQQTFELLMSMLPNLGAIGVPFAVELLEYSPLPKAMVEKWKQIVQQQPQANPQMVAQMQQAIQQLQGQLQQAQMRLMSKDQEIQARMAAAKLTADTELATSLEKARIEAQAEYQRTIEKARIDAEALIQQTIIKAQAATQQAEITKPLPPPAPIVNEPDDYGEIKGLVGQLVQAVNKLAESHGEACKRMDDMGEQVAKASRKPKGFKHVSDSEGRIIESQPVWE